MSAGFLTDTGGGDCNLYQSAVRLQGGDFSIIRVGVIRVPATWYDTVSFSVQLLEIYGVWKLSLHAAVSGFLAGKK